MTGNLAMVTNVDSIKQSIRNLILTNRGERFYQPMLGSKVASLLFDLYTPDTINLLQTTIKEVCSQEPRAQNVQVKINPDIQNNSIQIAIGFTPINLPEQVNFMIILKRVR